MSNVIVFGSLNMDLSIESPRMPQAGETLSGTGFVMNPGGKGANQAAAAARLGGTTYLIGAVGKDVFGQQLTASLESFGVSCEQVHQVSNVSTGIAVILRSCGDNRIILDAGANHVLTAQDVSKVMDTLVQPGDIFVTQLECDHQATFETLKDAHKRGLTTIFNPAPMAAIPADIWQSIDIVCINETECEALTGVLPEDKETLTQAALHLGELGVGCALITLGGQGSVVCKGGKVVQRVEAHKVSVVDTTCAGDTYLGAVAAALANGRALDAAVERASVAGALATTRVGAQQSIPTLAEVEALL